MRHRVLLLPLLLLLTACTGTPSPDPTPSPTPRWASSGSTARPAASSPALLIRKPDESLAIELSSFICVMPRFRFAFKDATFVLMRIEMFLP